MESLLPDMHLSLGCFRTVVCRGVPVNHLILGQCVSPSSRNLASFPVEVLHSSGQAASLVCPKLLPLQLVCCESPSHFLRIRDISKFTAELETKGIPLCRDGQRRRKDDLTFEALGDVEEFNSALSLAHEYCSQAQIRHLSSRLRKLNRGFWMLVQLLLHLSSLSKKLARVKFNPELVPVLEKWIDQMDGVLPSLTGFILPSGGLPASALHISRSVCKRAERKVVYPVSNELVEESVLYST